MRRQTLLCALAVGLAACGGESPPADGDGAAALAAELRLARERREAEDAGFERRRAAMERSSEKLSEYLEQADARRAAEREARRGE